MVEKLEAMSRAAISTVKFSLVRAVRAALVPLIVALPPLFWVVDGSRRASLTPLGRDQGIFQYVAWAILHGAKDYRDVRDVNGPLTHVVHILFLKLGGADEHRFRVLDLVVSGVAFLFVGACVPGILKRHRVDWIERLGWGVAGWVVLSAQYLAYVYWDLAQRESFFNWFMLASLALQLRARSPKMIAATGALSVIPWFGKPTYVLFSLAQIAALLVDRDLDLTRRRRLGLFALGGAIGALPFLVFLFGWGDAAAYARIQFVDVPAMYRFIWPRTAGEIFANSWYATQAMLSVAGGAVMLALVFFGELPRRTIAIAIAPACGLVSVVTQAKGFPYHFHPVTAAIALQWLVLVAWTMERFGSVPRARALTRLVPIVAATLVALRVASELPESPHVKATWLLYKGATPEQRETREYFAGFPEADFFPYELRQAARYLRDHTKATDRVQHYGMDPYVLFLAERMSASPYIYAYDLNADAAYWGGLNAHPDDAQGAKIGEIRDAHESDMLARLKSDPPAAFVFLDKSPLISQTDAYKDFVEHCEHAGAWVSENYRETATFGPARVWLRNDVAEAVAR